MTVRPGQPQSVLKGLSETLVGRARSSCQRGTCRWTLCRQWHSPWPLCLPEADCSALEPVCIKYTLDYPHLQNTCTARFYDTKLLLMKELFSCWIISVDSSSQRACIFTSLTSHKWEWSMLLPASHDQLKIYNSLYMYKKRWAQRQILGNIYLFFSCWKLILWHSRNRDQYIIQVMRKMKNIWYNHFSKNTLNTAC